MALYEAPTFVEDSAPPLSAANLNALASCAEANQSYTIAVTIPAASWSASGVQSVTVSGITASTVGFLSLAQSATATQATAATAAIIRVTAQSANTLTLQAYGNIPTVDLPCVVIVTSTGTITP